MSFRQLDYCTDIYNDSPKTKTFIKLRPECVVMLIVKWQKLWTENKRVEFNSTGYRRLYMIQNTQVHRSVSVFTQGWGLYLAFMKVNMYGWKSFHRNWKLFQNKFLLHKLFQHPWSRSRHQAKNRKESFELFVCESPLLKYRPENMFKR